MSVYVTTRLTPCAAPFVIFFYAIYWSLLIPILLLWAGFLLTLWLIKATPVVIKELPGAYRRAAFSAGYLVGKIKYRRRRYLPRHSR